MRRRFSRTQLVKKYSMEHSEADFHRAIDANPKESTNHLVYADWLEENGRPALAALIRGAGSKGYIHPVVQGVGQRRMVRDKMEGNIDTGFGSYLTITMPMQHDNKKRIVYGMSSPENTDSSLENLADQLEGEGFKIHRPMDGGR